MNPFNNTSKIIVTCPNRLAGYLRQEISAAGFQVKGDGLTYIETQGTLNDCIKLNLLLRTGNSVLYELKSFQAIDTDDLYEGVRSLPWELLLNENGYFSITCHVRNESINNTMFTNMKVKDAIVDRIKGRKGCRPNSGPDRHQAVIHLHWTEKEASLFIDSSGETLSKHGYRKHPGLAPMQENLAAGVVMATEWKEGETFINPMCGTGTLVIEAALMGLRRAPGLLRDHFGFMDIMGFDKTFYAEQRQAAKMQALKRIPSKIIATDIDHRAISMAKQNASTAGVDHLIEFHTCDFRETPIPKNEKGIILFNPGYGERLGTMEHLEDTYQEIGNFMKRSCQGYRGYVFTGNTDLAKKIGLKTSRKIEFYNSKLDCRLLAFDLYDGSKKHGHKISTT